MTTLRSLVGFLESVKNIGWISLGTRTGLDDAARDPVFKAAARRQFPLVRAAGFEIVQVERLKAGTVERIFARKSVSE